jgi:KUP system potassium uptake protein
MEYGVEELMDDKVIRVEFRLGFRIQPKVGMLFRKVVTEMMENRELDVVSRFPSLKKHNIAEDFRFVILEKFLSYDNEFSVRDGFILNSYFSLKKLALAEEKAFGLDSSETIVEKLPLVVAPVTKLNLQRTYYRIHPTPSAEHGNHLVNRG